MIYYIDDLRKFEIFQMNNVKSDKLRFILYMLHIITCDASKAGRSEERWEISKQAGDLVLNLQFSKESKVCLQSRLEDAVYNIWCKRQLREESLDHFLDFLADLARMSIGRKNSQFFDTIILTVKLIKQLKPFLFKYLADPRCPEKKPDAAKIRPKKVRRQFGVTDTLHTLKTIFCDPIVIEGYATEMEERYNKTFTAWGLGYLGKTWCCLINGEWKSMVAPV